MTTTTATTTTSAAYLTTAGADDPLHEYFTLPGFFKLIFQQAILILLPLLSVNTFFANLSIYQFIVYVVTAASLTQ